MRNEPSVRKLDVVLLMPYSTFEFAGMSVVQVIVAEFWVIFEAVILAITGAAMAVAGAVVLVDDPPAVTFTTFDSP